MSIYQPRRKRWPLVVGGIACLLLGMLAGFLVWGTRPPDPLEALAATQATLDRSADAVDVVKQHADFAAEEGEVSPEYPGSAEAITRAEALFAEAEPVVRLVDDATAEGIGAQFVELSEAIAVRRPPEEVSAMSADLAAAIRAAV